MVIMATRKTLHLHEEILLLALHDDKGTIEVGSMYAYAVGGALLAELVVRGRVELTGPEKKRMVELVDRKPIGARLLDESLTRIANAKRRASVGTWVSRLAGSKKLRDRLADGLCQRGILRAEEKEVLLVFKRRTYPALDPEPESDIVERLRSTIFTDADVDARTVVLLSLAEAAGLLHMVFDKKALKARRERIRALVEQETLGKAVTSAIEAVQAAMMVATIT